MQVRMTYKYKLYNSKQNRHLDHAIDIAAEIWNHCIVLHRRYYRMYGKFLSANRLKVFLAKLKKRKKYAHWKQLGSQAIQDIPERINRSYEWSEQSKPLPSREPRPENSISAYPSFRNCPKSSHAQVMLSGWTLGSSIS